MSKPAAAMNSPLRYLYGLQIYVSPWRLQAAQSGRSPASRAQTRRRTIPRPNPRMVREKQNVVVLQDMYDHLANAQHFVMKWQTNNPPMSPGRHPEGAHPQGRVHPHALGHRLQQHRQQGVVSLPGHQGARPPQK